MGEDIKDGPFNDFPHYQTLGTYVFKRVYTYVYINMNNRISRCTCLYVFAFIHIYFHIYMNIDICIIAIIKGGGMNYERSNLLANMVGWSILENKRLFQDLCS
jgi:hypothetical protein